MRPESTVMIEDQVPFELRMLPIPVAAKALGISKSLLWRVISAGDIKVVRYRRTTRIPGSEIIRHHAKAVTAPQAA